jgi:hypothetical protein
MKFFKSTPKPAEPARVTRPATPGATRPEPDKPVRPAMPPVPPPLPEVSEGNLESDWAMWEDSVAFQDSQMPSVFNELDAVKTRDEPPKKKESGPDPFSAVRKRGS